MTKQINFNLGEQFRVDSVEELAEAFLELKDNWNPQHSLFSEICDFKRHSFKYLNYFEDGICLSRNTDVKEIPNPFKTQKEEQKFKVKIELEPQSKYQLIDRFLHKTDELSSAEIIKAATAIQDIKKEHNQMSDSLTDIAFNNYGFTNKGLEYYAKKQLEKLK